MLPSHYLHIIILCKLTSHKMKLNRMKTRIAVRTYIQQSMFLTLHWEIIQKGVCIFIATLTFIQFPRTHFVFISKFLCPSALRDISTAVDEIDTFLRSMDDYYN